MTKPIIVNKAEALAFAAYVLRERWPRSRAAYAKAAPEIVVRSISRDPRYARRVNNPRPSDPAWVTDRLAEGKIVRRIRTTVFTMELALRPVVDDLVDLTLECHEAGARLVWGLESGARRERLERLLDSACGLSSADLRRLVERELRRAGKVPGRPATRSEMERPFAAPRTVAAGRAVWRLCTTPREVEALGRALENCLARVATQRRQRRRYAKKGFALWGLWAGDNAVGAAEITPDGALCEALGPRNAPWPDGDGGALEALARALPATNLLD